MQSENMAKRNGSKDMIDSTKTMMARIIKDAAGYPITVNKVKIKGCKLECCRALMTRKALK